MIVARIPIRGRPLGGLRVARLPGNWYHSARAPHAPEQNVTSAITAMSTIRPIIQSFFAISFPPSQPMIQACRFGRTKTTHSRGMLRSPQPASVTVGVVVMIRHGYNPATARLNGHDAA